MKKSVKLKNGAQFEFTHLVYGTGWVQILTNGERELITESGLRYALDRIWKLETEGNIKSDFLSSRQCPDHSGKWERGRCLQCEIEELRLGISNLLTDDRKPELSVEAQNELKKLLEKKQ